MNDDEINYKTGYTFDIKLIEAIIEKDYIN